MIKIQKYDKIEILKRSEIALLDDLDKKELIQIIQKLEKENNELKEKLYGKIEEKEVETEAKAISSEEKVKSFGTTFLACFFRFALALICVPSTNMASVSR